LRLAQRQGSNSSTRLTGERRDLRASRLQKKFKGIATPKAELDKITRRLKEAEQAILENER